MVQKLCYASKSVTDGRTDGRTDARTHARTNVQEAICPLQLLRSWGHKKTANITTKSLADLY